MSDDAPVFLIGYRGTGKTTVARLLAERLGWEWIDADEVLQERAGRSIKRIFEEAGEASFREQETAILAELCMRPRCVVATGGGVVLREENRQRLRSAGTVVWLTATVDTICARLANDPRTAELRPMLTVGGRAEVEHLLQARAALYRECATFTVPTDAKTAAEVAGAIAEFI